MIESKQLQPTLRTVYMRTAFQVPYDASVRCSLARPGAGIELCIQRVGGRIHGASLYTRTCLSDGVQGESLVPHYTRMSVSQTPTQGPGRKPGASACKGCQYKGHADVDGTGVKALLGGHVTGDGDGDPHGRPHVPDAGEVVQAGTPSIVVIHHVLC